MAAHKNRIPLPGSERSARSGSRVVGAPDPNELIQISVLLRPRTPLESLTSTKELGAGTPQERRYLSREQFAATYGADPRDVALIEAFAHEHNLTVVEANLARRTVVLSGTVAALSASTCSRTLRRNPSGSSNTNPFGIRSRRIPMVLR